MAWVRRRHRAVAVAVALASSPLWAAASGPPGHETLVVPEVVPPALVAAITAGRPDGYPIGGIDVSSHDHRRDTAHRPPPGAARRPVRYVQGPQGPAYV